MRILIVEDDLELREMLADDLTDRHYHVLQASNGKEALAILENESVDMIITDVQMPIMDGMNFLKAVRSKYRNHPPVFVVTGGCQYPTSQFFKEGASACFEKPISIDKILARRPAAS